MRKGQTPSPAFLRQTWGFSASIAKAEDVDGAKALGGAILFWMRSVICLSK